MLLHSVPGVMNARYVLHVPCAPNRQLMFAQPQQDAFFQRPEEEGADDTVNIFFGQVYDEEALRFCMEICQGDVDLVSACGLRGEGG